MINENSNELNGKKKKKKETNKKKYSYLSNAEG